MRPTLRPWAIALTLVCALVDGARALEPAGRAQNPWNRTRIVPVADTFVTVQGAPLPTSSTRATATPRPKGSDDTLSLGFNHVGSTRDVAYMRFELPTPAPDTFLVLADLELSVLNVALHPYQPPIPTTGTMAIEVQALGEAWQEESLFGPDVPVQAGDKVVGRFAWGPCPDPAQTGCGTVQLDVFALLGRHANSDAARNGFALRADPFGHEVEIFGWNLTVGSRESVSPPRLRLAYQPVGLDGPVDLAGDAITNCATGAVDVTLRNNGANPVLVDVILEASSTPPRRIRVPGPIAAGAEVVHADAEWAPGTAVYAIDPDGRLGEANVANNEIAVQVLDCPGLSGPRVGVNYLPVVMRHR